MAPPLRERIDDVPLLVECFLDRHAERLGRQRPEISPEAVAGLQAQSWPGNIRELENAVERAILLAESATLSSYDFGLADKPSAPATHSSLKDASRAAAAETERRMIRAALEATNSNITHAAQRLGLSRRGLQLKMKELGLR
jgi:DNA-binding NtrC family response regulator